MKTRPPAARPPVRPLLYLLVFTAGFAVMLVEITAPRILGPFFGTSAHVWTNVIGVILAALSLGYYLGGRLADRWPSPRLLAGIVMGGCAVTALTPVVAPVLGRAILPAGLGLGQAYDLLRFGSLVTAACVFFPPALLLAVVGPFTIRCVVAHDRVGRSAGTVYALGTVGSLLGTFLPTFVLIPWLGSRSTVLGATAVLFLVALVVYLAHGGRARAALPVLLVLLAAWLVVGRTPIRPAQAGERLLGEGESAYQYVRASEVGAGDQRELRLQVNEPVTDYHSLWRPGRLLTGSYYDHYALLPYLLPEAVDAAPASLSVLILGLAGGVISRQYHALF
ncbi:MAG: fused MFS/spermidine synthase, partial [Planctomycetes bacterium]|nr:fused MFS/spermidine synthase [Planctomycetota bacterium]